MIYSTNYPPIYISAMLLILLVGGDTPPRPCPATAAPGCSPPSPPRSKGRPLPLS